jgi:hypothetical protein
MHDGGDRPTSSVEDPTSRRRPPYKHADALCSRHRYFPIVSSRHQIRHPGRSPLALIHSLARRSYQLKPLSKQH